MWSIYTHKKVKCNMYEYALSRVLHMTALVAATFIVSERSAFAVRQSRIFEKLVGTHHVLGSFHMVAREMFRGPQRAMRDTGMQDGEVGVAEHARLRRHLLIDQHRPLRVGREFRAGGRGRRVSRDDEQQRGKPFLHESGPGGRGQKYSVARGSSDYCPLAGRKRGRRAAACVSDESLKREPGLLIDG
jgi:hypothetical protein